MLTPFAVGVFRNLKMEVRNEFLKSDRASKSGNNSKYTDSQLKKHFLEFQNLNVNTVHLKR